MKKLLLLCAAFMLLASVSAYSSTGRSMLYSDSFMLRARGAEANYWNPALLNRSYNDVLFPVLNLGIYIANNSLDLDLYNSVVEKDFLTEEDKDEILDAIDEKLGVYAGSQIVLFGFSKGRSAVTSSLHLDAQGNLSEQYLELLLRGNTEDSYVFTKKQNNASALSYVDITYGMGDIRIPLGKKLNPIQTGFALSILTGVGSGHTENYEGRFSSTYDGLSLKQDILLRAGLGGFGLKGTLGAAWQTPLPGLSTGFALDNILGFINWQARCMDFSYRLEADSVYVENLGEDLDALLTDESEEIEGKPFTTKLPLEFRGALLYDFPYASLSVDYFTGLTKTEYSPGTGRVAFALESKVPAVMPLFLGFTPGNSDYPWRVSYGIGLRTRKVECGLGVQSFKSLLPGYKTKGLAFATYFTIRT